MKAKYSLISLLLVITIGISALFTGCFSPWEGTNAFLTIGLGVSSENRAVEMLSELEHDIDLEGPTGNQTIHAEKGKTSVSVTVAPGTWNIRVRAYLENDDFMRELCYEGSATVELKPGKNNPVKIQMRDVREVEGESYDFEWELNNDKTGIIITKYTGDGGDVSIPMVIEDTLVVTIGISAFYNITSLVTVIIPDNIITIESGAFSGCSGLTGITIGNGVVSIGMLAFQNCTSLTNVILPGSVSTIGDSAFYNCSGISSIIIPESVNSIGTSAFASCSNLNSVTFEGYILEEDFPLTAFPGYLQMTYLATDNSGGPGTYTRQPNGTTWIKQTGDSAVTNSAIQGVTIPVRGETPVTDIAENDQYIGTVTWEPASGVTFAPSTTYTATITLTAKQGFTLEGVTPNFFTVAGAAATNSADSGVVSAVFPPTTEENVFTVTFDKNNYDIDSEEANPQTTTVNPPATTIDSLPIPPTRTGYAFSEWNTVAEGSGSSFVQNSPVTDNITVYAQWAAYTLSIDYNGGGGVGNDPASPITALYGTSISMPANTYTRSGYTFAGWEVSGTGSVPGIYLENVSVPVANLSTDIKSGSAGITLTATWAEVPPPPGLQYDASGATVTITGYTEPSGNVVIPSVIEGKPVTKIGDGAFQLRYQITGVTIPDSVTTIGDLAFAGCGFTEITIPGSVTSIGVGSFSSCYFLSAINVDSTNANYSTFEGVLFNKDQTVLAVYPEGKGSVYTIPGSVTSIGDGAFAVNSSLTAVTIPYGVTSIGEAAFQGCVILNSVTFDGDIPEINFSSTDSFPGDLREKYLTAGGGPGTYTRTTGGTVWEKEILPFDNLTDMTAYLNGLTANTVAAPYILPLNFDLGNMPAPGSGWQDILAVLDTAGKFVKLDLSACTMNGTAFDAAADIAAGKSRIVSLTLPDIATSITGIGSDISANKNFTNLTSVKAAGLISIWNGAFYECTSLVSIELSTELNSIGDAAFMGCTNLAGIELPPNLATIGNSAFNGCTSLPEIELPAGLTLLGDGAFANCQNLVLTKLPVGLSSIGDGTFYDCAKIILTELPTELISIGDGAFANCTGLALTTLPAKLISIGNEAFNGCTGLVLEELPSGLNSIGNGAFANCTGLALTTLPAGLEFIEDSTFFSCEGLIQLELPNGITSIGEGAFNNCKNLVEIRLPSELASIENGAFAHCESLLSIVLPAKLSFIGEYAFDACTNLKSVTFEGIIDGNNISTTVPFMGYLRDEYLKPAPEGGIGTYTTTATGYSAAWTKNLLIAKWYSNQVYADTENTEYLMYEFAPNGNIFIGPTGDEVSYFYIVSGNTITFQMPAYGPTDPLGTILYQISGTALILSNSTGEFQSMEGTYYKKQ